MSEFQEKIIIDDDMLFRVNEDLSKRSVNGSFIYLLIWFAIIIPYDFYLVAPELCLWSTIFFIVFGGLRALLIVKYRKIYGKNPLVWKLLFYPVIWLPSLVWGVFCALTFTHPSFQQIDLPILLSTAGLMGGSAAAFAPSTILTVGIFSGFLLPTIGILSVSSAYNPSILIIFSIYGIGMYAVTRISHREYWLALNYSFLIKKHAARLEELNTMDGLTNLKNRAYFDEALDRELKTARRLNSALSLLLLDIDHFKSINDRYGHLVGDECLRRLARLLPQKITRDTDVIARYGGEEFAVILPGTETAQAVLVAERVRTAVERLEHRDGAMTFSFTVSIGVASLELQPDLSREKLIELADSALYRAKHNGRNRVERQ